MDYMKKIFLVGIILFCATFNASAQKTVNGVVVDKSGKAVPGTKIELVGTSESTITDLDGTFSIVSQSSPKQVRAYYVGMQTKTQTIEPNMRIVLEKTTWWNRIPDKSQWFINPVVAFPSSKDVALGLMVGKVKDYGWYIKAIYSGKPSSDVDYNEDYWTNGNRKTGYMAVTAGAMYRVYNALHVYGGLGYCNREVTWQLSDGCYEDSEDDSYSGVAFDYGVMLKTGVVNVSIGGIYTFGGKNAVNVGVGVNF